ncbi:MAG: hypothetical protein JRI68_03300 [Deltaproteobacteria bacterium]|nr:hypothetical protein [Deltaproteobacteria bacterium]
MTQSRPTDPGPSPRQPSRRRKIARVQSLDSLVGAHPDALRDIYEAGSPADPGELGAKPRGRLLAVEPLVPIFALTRPLVRVVAQHLLPWKGKVFETGGTAGRNRVLRWQLFRFHCEVEASALDGQPTLVLRYDGLGNPWPLPHVVDELRRVGDGVAIGPASLAVGGAQPRVLAWWGLTTQA